MKNVYLLQTDKPSKIFYGSGSKHIYIIVLDEDVKEGDWCLDEDGILKCTAHAGAMNHYYNKIVLTTDPKLIEDGVQPINNEFIEWFAKNQSCEYVEIFQDKKDYGAFQWYSEYKIIIPKEEIKKDPPKELISKITPEQEVLTTIQFLTSCNNDSQALRALEQYGDWKQEEMYKEQEVFELLMKFSSRDKNSSSGTPHSIAEWFEQFKKNNK